MKYTCHSGGCPGADIFWETEGRRYGVVTIAYSFHNHVQNSKNQKILTVSELNEGFQHVLKANEFLHRNPEATPQYVKNLLARNWFQVKNAEAIFAVGFLHGSFSVEGGTGWAVQMAIDEKKPVFVFDQNEKAWYTYHYSDEVMNQFIPCRTIPKLTENFAGIGTRKLDENGKNAIIEVYRETFCDIGVNGSTQASQT